MTKKSRLLIGAHLSISGGFTDALEIGQSIGCTTMQIFTKSNRQWRARPISNEAAEAFINHPLRKTINPVVVHASYLINIATSAEELSQKSLEALILEIERCEQLEIPYLIVHPGSAGTQTKEAAIKQVVHHVKMALSHTKKTTVLLETMAGQGNIMGGTLKEMAAMIEPLLHTKRIGICVDTCHIFAAGHDISTHAGYETFWTAVDKTVGINHVKVIHTNDSMKGAGSHIDRHADIGKGVMTLDAFKYIMNDERLYHIPKILETPHATPADDHRNILTLKSLLTEKTKHALEVK